MISTPPYVELHARSAFSFLEGSSVPEELIARAAALGQPALAMLDRNNISGAARFHMAAKKAGFRAHNRGRFSFLEGSSVPEELIARAAALGQPALAMLDRDNISGTARLHMATKKAGFRAHNRGRFSFLEGSSVPEELIARAAALGQPALAMLDRDNISGTARLHMAAKKAGLRAHNRGRL